MFIYVLKLTNNKWYVGKTTNIVTRLEQHFNFGSVWTFMYKPLGIEKCFKGDHFDEDKWTLKYMNTYGIPNVRGGSFSQVKLDEDHIKMITKQLQTANDNCYRCGGRGHFSKNCYLPRRK